MFIEVTLTMSRCAGYVTVYFPLRAMSISLDLLVFSGKLHRFATIFNPPSSSLTVSLNMTSTIRYMSSATKIMAARPKTVKSQFDNVLTFLFKTVT